LDEYIIRGVRHNVSFLRAVMENSKFLSGDISTKFIAEEFPTGFHGKQMTGEERIDIVNMAASIYFQENLRKTKISDQMNDHYRDLLKNSGLSLIVEIKNESDEEENSKNKYQIFVSHEKKKTILKLFI